jgi:hypothetical protein
MKTFEAQGGGDAEPNEEDIRSWGTLRRQTGGVVLLGAAIKLVSYLFP